MNRIFRLRQVKQTGIYLSDHAEPSSSAISPIGGRSLSRLIQVLPIATESSDSNLVVCKVQAIRSGARTGFREAEKNSLRDFHFAAKHHRVHSPNFRAGNHGNHAKLSYFLHELLAMIQDSLISRY